MCTHKIFLEKNINKGDYISDDKNKLFSIDELFKLITILLTSIGIVIYCYSLGYFDQMGIPAYPSFKGSIYFFFKNLARYSPEEQSNAIGLLILLSSLIFAQFYPKLIKAEKYKKIILVSAIIITLFGCSIVPVAVPVYIMILASGMAIRFLLDKKEGIEFNNAQNYLGYISLLCLCSIWSFNSFSLKNLVEKKSLDNYFSKGIVLGVANTSSWLIWSDEEIFYWAYCSEMRSYIYGTKDMEKAFIKIQMGNDIIPFLCSDK